MVLLDTVLVSNIRQLSLWYAGMFPLDAPGLAGRTAWNAILILTGVVGFPAATATLAYAALRKRSGPNESLSQAAIFLAGSLAIVAELALAPQWIHGVHGTLPGIFLAAIEGGYLIAAVVVTTLGFATVWFSKRVSGQRRGG